MNLITITATGLLAFAAPIAAPWLTQDVEANATPPELATKLRASSATPGVTPRAELTTRGADLSALRSSFAPAQPQLLATAPPAIDDEDARREAAELQQQIAKLQAQIALLEAQSALESASDQVLVQEASNAQIRDAHDRLVLVERQRKELDNMASELDVRIADVSNQRSDLDVRVLELEKVIANMGEYSGDARRELGAELDALTAERLRLDDESNHLEAQMHDLLVAMGEGGNLENFFVDAQAAAENAERYRILADEEAANLFFLEVEREQREAERELEEIERERERLERRMGRLHDRQMRAADNGKDEVVSDLADEIMVLHDELLQLSEVEAEMHNAWSKILHELHTEEGAGGLWAVDGLFGDEECEECEDQDDYRAWISGLHGDEPHELWAWLEGQDGDGNDFEALYEILLEAGAEQPESNPFRGGDAVEGWLELEDHGARDRFQFEDHFEWDDEHEHEWPHEMEWDMDEWHGHFEDHEWHGEEHDAGHHWPGDFDAHHVDGHGFPGGGMNINAGGDVNINSGSGGGDRDAEIIELLREIRDEVRGLREDLRSMDGANHQQGGPRSSRYEMGLHSEGRLSAPTAPSPRRLSLAAPPSPSTPSAVGGPFAPTPAALPESAPTLRNERHPEQPSTPAPPRRSRR